MATSSPLKPPPSPSSPSALSLPGGSIRATNPGSLQMGFRVRRAGWRELETTSFHPGDNPGANLTSIPNRCYPILVAFVWELTKETIKFSLGCFCGVPEKKRAMTERISVALSY